MLGAASRFHAELYQSAESAPVIKSSSIYQVLMLVAKGEQILHV